LGDGSAKTIQIVSLNMTPPIAALLQITGSHRQRQRRRQHCPEIVAQIRRDADHTVSGAVEQCREGQCGDGAAQTEPRRQD
jgi:hypothetical protein